MFLIISNCYSNRHELVKLSEWIDNGSGIMPLKSPGGSTLQWGLVRDLLCLASFVADAMLKPEAGNS